MAVTLTDGQSPIIMDTAGDQIATLFQGRDMNDVIPVPKLWITGIQFEAPAGGGICTLLHKPGGGVAYSSGTMSANQEVYIKVDPHWCMNLVCFATWPAGSRVLIHFS